MRLLKVPRGICVHTNRLFRRERRIAFPRGGRQLPTRVLPQHADGLGKAIAGSALGNDQLRIGMILFDLAAQAQYRHVDRSIVNLNAVQA